MPDDKDKKTDVPQKTENKPKVAPSKIDFSIPSTENQGKKKSEPTPTEEPVTFHKRND
jgi:hypothetical protein